MAVVKFSHTARAWCKLQVSLYIRFPEQWAVGATVLEEIGSTTPTLLADGSATNVLEMSDVDLSDLLDDSKPYGYNTTTDTLPAGCQIYEYTDQKWNASIQAAKDDRERYQVSQAADPLDPMG